MEKGAKKGSGLAGVADPNDRQHEHETEPKMN